MDATATSWAADPSDLLRAGLEFDLSALDRAATPGWTGTRAEADTFRKSRGKLLSELQERLFAAGKLGDDRSVLMIVQGLDTAGKGGIVRHVAGMMDPQGLMIRSFGVPTEEERSHHYLWRVRRALPTAGRVGIFDRSHYEDVLVVKVDQLADVDWEARYAEINRFERQAAAGGITIVKIALMVSKDEQGVRLMERLARPDKHWKFNPGDVDTRSKWDSFQQAYAEMFAATSTDIAPWYVIPADKKWYARLAVTELLTQAMASLALTWPKPRWRVETQQRRLAATMSPEALAAAADATAGSVIEAQADDLAVAAAVERVRELEASDGRLAAGTNDAEGEAGASPDTADRGKGKKNAGKKSKDKKQPEKKRSGKKAEKAVTTSSKKAAKKSKK